METLTLTWAYQQSRTITTMMTGNKDFEEYMQYLMNSLNLQKPTDFQSALQLYLRLVPIVQGTS